MSNFITLTSGATTVEVPRQSVFRSSVVLGTLIEDFSGSNTVTDTAMTIPLPDKFTSILNNYSSCLFNACEPIITDAQQLLSVFEFADYLEDDKYFKYALKQLFDGWDNFHHIISNGMSPQVRERVLMMCPYDALPPSNDYRNNKIFMGRWLDIQNRTVTLNKTHKYWINKVLQQPTTTSMTSIIESFSVINNNSDGKVLLTSYVEFRGKKQGASYSYVYNLNNKDNDDPLLINLLIDGKKWGIWETFIRDFKVGGILKKKANYENDELHGCYEVWYSGDTMTVKERGSYDHGKKVGAWESNYNKLRDVLIRPECREFYNQESKLHGEVVKYYRNGVAQSRGTYNNGVKVGNHKTCHDNKQTYTMQKYNRNGIPIGEWKIFSEDGIIMRTSVYENGSITTECMYEDGIIMRKCVYENVNITSESVYENGSIIETCVYKNGELVDKY